MKNLKEFILESNNDKLINNFYNSHKNIFDDKPEFNGSGKCVLSINDNNVINELKKQWNKNSDLVKGLLNNTIKFEEISSDLSKEGLMIYDNGKPSGEIYISGIDREQSLDFIINVISANKEENVIKLGINILNQLIK